MLESESPYFRIVKPVRGEPHLLTLKQITDELRDNGPPMTVDQWSRQLELCREALKRVGPHSDPWLWANLLSILGNNLVQNLSDSYAGNIEEAIGAYEQVLTVYMREEVPVQWAWTTRGLAFAYRVRIHGDAETNLEHAIALYQQVLTVFSREDEPVEWAWTTDALAQTYAARICGNKEENTEHAIELYEAALAIFVEFGATKDCAAITNNLAKAYQKRMRGSWAEKLHYDEPKSWASLQVQLGNILIQNRTGAYADNIEEAIKAYEQALTVYTQENLPVEWAATLTALATAYRYRMRGDLGENIERSLQLDLQARIVRTRELMPFEWAETTRNLANAYNERILGEREANQEQAINLYKETLTVYSQHAFPLEWARTLNNLANVYINRIRGDRAENQEQAIPLYDQALTVITSGLDWAKTKCNLAKAYKDRIRGDRAQNLEKAIQSFGWALIEYKQETMPVDWAGTTADLAGVYQARIQGEEAQNQEHAIALYEDALKVITREALPIWWARTTVHLASAYQVRIRGDRAKNQEKAIALYEEALKVQEALPMSWAATIVMLASAYEARIQGPQEDNQEHAKRLYERALTIYKRDTMPTEWAWAAVHLASAYQVRIRGDRAENQEKAIALYEKALKVQQEMPISWAATTVRLASAYQARIQGRQEDNQEQAVRLYERALTVYTREAMAAEHRAIQTHLGDLFFTRRDWPQAIAAYYGVLEAQELLYEAAVTSDARLAELGNVQHVPACLAYALTAQKTDNLDEAVVVLERGRVRSLSESLDLEQGLPETLTKDDRFSLQISRGRVKGLQDEGRLREDPAERRDYVTYAQEMDDARRSLRQIVERVRSYAPEFLSHDQLSDIQQAAERSDLIYLATTAQGGVALCVSAKTSRIVVTPIDLPDLREDLLRGKLNLYFGAFHEWRRLPANRELRQAALNALDELLEWLWGAAMKDIVCRLSPTRLTTLIPAGILVLAPLHAAWRKDASAVIGPQYVLDAGQIAYAPSAKVLKWAQSRTDMPANSILGISQPLSTIASPLPNSFYEVNTALSHFDPARTKRMQREEATRADVMKLCPEYSVLHFSCHGRVNFQAPLESGLLMAHDELLTVRDFIGLRLKGARLAVLSACETGLPGAEIPDEMIGLPAGLLEAGVPGVVGSMWSVNDASTMMLMAYFYEQWRSKLMPPAAALREAQLRVRNTTNQEKAEYFRRFSVEWRAYESRMIGRTAEGPYRDAVLEEPLEKPFAHPYYWAGFSYFGA